jgi:hypothetical protein
MAALGNLRQRRLTFFFTIHLLAFTADLSKCTTLTVTHAENATSVAFYPIFRLTKARIFLGHTPDTALFTLTLHTQLNTLTLTLTTL